MTIKILPSQVSDQIAAGEVVERPVSVVKELVENSIDAGATNIEIHIEEGGKKLIEIRDDGIGMDKDDATKCILRHATSKIGSTNDLFSIQSFGFRGEALAAISAVSKFELITKTKTSEGIKISVEGGENLQVSPASANTGTTIQIRDLFYPTPVRLEYLKTDETEYRAILKEVQAFAIAHSHIGFKLFKNEKLSLDYVARNDEKARIQQVFPKTLQNVMTMSLQHNDVVITGFVSRPEDCVTTKNNQYLFVNGRHVEDFKLNYAIREGYVQSCGIEKHLNPAFVLFINLDPILVDVNVHPRKTEIKFSEPQEMFSLVKRATINALEHNRTQSPTFSDFPKFKSSQPTRSQVSAGNNFSKELFGSMPSFTDRNNSRGLTRSDTIPVNFDDNTSSLELETKELQLVGQIGNKYIAAESEKGMYIFDQHALHERQRFEVLWKKYKSKDAKIQKLLTSEKIDMSEEEVLVLYEHQKEIKKMGFMISFPEDNCIEVMEIPSLFVKKDLRKVFSELVSYFQNDKIGEHSLDMLMRKLLEYESCRGSVMFGDNMKKEEMQELINNFAKTRHHGLCPHGRPNYTFIPFSELDKKFHR